MTTLPINPSIDLEYLCTVIGNMAGVPIRIYTNNILSFYHSYVSLPKDPISLYESEVLKIEDAVGYYITSDFDYYGVSHHGDQSIIIGPARQSPSTEQQLHKMAFDLGCTIYSGKPIDQARFEQALKKLGLI